MCLLRTCGEVGEAATSLWKSRPELEGVVNDVDPAGIRILLELSESLAAPPVRCFKVGHLEG